MIFKNKVIKANRTANEIKGDAAESQMAFYLKRYFGSSGDIHVINDVCISKDKEYAQIDHLVVTPFRTWIIESKSTSGRFVIDGGGQWVKKINGREFGMASPIQQAKLQSRILIEHLQKYDCRLLDYIPHLMIRIAVSADGIIEDYRDSRGDVIKADLLCDQIILQHESDARDEQYNITGENKGSSSELAKYILNADKICRNARDGVVVTKNVASTYFWLSVLYGISNLIEAKTNDWPEAYIRKNNPHLWIHDPVFKDEIERDMSETFGPRGLIRFYESMCVIDPDGNEKDYNCTTNLNKPLTEREKEIAEARAKVVLPKPTRPRYKKP